MGKGEQIAMTEEEAVTAMEAEGYEASAIQRHMACCEIVVNFLKSNGYALVAEAFETNA